MPLMLLDGHWAVLPGKLAAMRDALEHMSFTEDQLEAFMTRVSRADPGQDVFTRDGKVAHVLISGMMTKRVSFYFSLFGEGNTAYGDIVHAIQAADGDDDIERIVLEIDSPGGHVEGMFDAAMAIRNASKPVVAEVTDMAASAAYLLAAQADSIILNNRMAVVGSIGIMTSQYISDHEVTIRSTDAPLKNPDASTKAGVEAIREMLDSIHVEFALAIAEGRSQMGGRGLSVEDVNSDFGRGGILLGEAALAAGMVDAIASSETATRSTSQARATSMDLDKLKAEYPAIYAAVIALGVAEGVAQERDRVIAHITSAENFGASKEAFAFIKEGAEFTSSTVQAAYLGAGARKGEADAREDEGKKSDPGTDEPKAKAGGDEVWNEDASELTDAATNAVFDGLAELGGL